MRRARDVDVPALTELTRRVYVPYVARMGREPAPMLADHAVAVRDDEVWVAEDDGRIVGLLHLRLGSDIVALAPPAVGQRQPSRVAPPYGFFVQARTVTVLACTETGCEQRYRRGRPPAARERHQRSDDEERPPQGRAGPPTFSA